MSRWQFRPRAWAALGTAAACTLMVLLGIWQLQRADYKRQWLRNYAAAAVLPPQTLTLATPVPAADVPLHVRVRGRYLPERQLYLDNQVQDERAGFDVWTPLQLDSGGVVWVDRGWLPPADGERGLPTAPPPDGAVVVTGLWRALPRAGWSVANSVCGDDATRIVQYPRIDELRCLFDAPLADGVLLLDAEAAGGYRRAWQVQTLPPSRHLAYALQWFAFAGTLLAFFVGLNLKKIG